MIITTELNQTFAGLFGVTILAALITGSSLQWVVVRGLFRAYNQYNILVAIAAVTSLNQTVWTFINTIMAPHNNLVYTVIMLLNWVVMTHSSVLLVSRKLSLTYNRPELAWKRLLYINYFMFPISVFVYAAWALTHNPAFAARHNISYDDLIRVNRLVEPVQISLWGLIEFCVSGAFVAQMWKFHWTPVQRQGVYILFLVGLCDLSSVLINLFIGDLPSTCVKGFVYCLRIRLEIGVLDYMVEYIQSKRRAVVYVPTEAKQSQDSTGGAFWRSRGTSRDHDASKVSISRASSHSMNIGIATSSRDENESVVVPIDEEQCVQDVSSKCVNSPSADNKANGNKGELSSKVVEKSYTRKVTIDFTGSTAELGDDDETCHV